MMLGTNLMFPLRDLVLSDDKKSIKIRLADRDIMQMSPDSVVHDFKLQAGYDGAPQSLSNLFILLSDKSQKVRMVKLTKVHSYLDYGGHAVVMVFPFEVETGKVLGKLSNTVKKYFPDYHSKQYLARAKAVIATLDRRPTVPSLKRQGPPLRRLSNEKYKLMVRRTTRNS